MKKDPSSDDDARGQFLVYAAEDGRIKIDVRLADETVWLTQPLMADLFQTTQQNISQHIRNVYDEGELASEATNKKFLSVRQVGGRAVQRNLDHYNLDMIISVGYRVKSHATRFRIWATQRLKDDIIKVFGCSIVGAEANSESKDPHRTKSHHEDGPTANHQRIPLRPNNRGPSAHSRIRL